MRGFLRVVNAEFAAFFGLFAAFLIRSRHKKGGESRSLRRLMAAKKGRSRSPALQACPHWPSISGLGPALASEELAQKPAARPLQRLAVHGEALAIDVVDGRRLCVGDLQLPGLGDEAALPGARIVVAVRQLRADGQLSGRGRVDQRLRDEPRAVGHIVRYLRMNASGKQRDRQRHCYRRQAQIRLHVEPP